MERPLSTGLDVTVQTSVRLLWRYSALVLGRASIIALLLAGAGQSIAQELLYKVSPAPKEWRLPLCELSKRPPPKPAQTPPPPPGPAGKFDRDFSGPEGSPGFVAPLGFAPQGVLLQVRLFGMTGLQFLGESIRLFCRTATQTTSIAAAKTARGGMLSSFGQDVSALPIIGSSKCLCRGGFKRRSIPQARSARRHCPPVREAVLSIVLGRAVPSGKSFQSEEPKDGARSKVWREGGLPRIVLKKRVSDDALIEARMMAPGTADVIDIWQVNEWKDRHPVKGVRFSILPQNQSLDSKMTGDEAKQLEHLNGDLYTLVDASPSRNPTAEDVFMPGFLILDYRAKLESRREGFSYPWKGRLMDIAEMKRIDREKGCPIPCPSQGHQRHADGDHPAGRSVCAALYSRLGAPSEDWATEKIGFSVLK